MKQLDMQEILDKNPEIDLEFLRKIQESAAELQQLGTPGLKGYRLAPPSGVKRAHLVEEASEDIVRLRRL